MPVEFRDPAFWQVAANAATCVAAIASLLPLFGLWWQIRVLNKTTKHQTRKALREALARLNEMTQNESKTKDEKRDIAYIYRLNYFQEVQDAQDCGLLSKDEWEAEKCYMTEEFKKSGMQDVWLGNREIYTETLMTTLDPLLPAEKRKDISVGKRKKIAASNT